MMLVRYFLIVMFLTTVWAVAVFPQSKTKLKPLAEDATLADTQKWLAEALPKSGAYKAGRSGVKLTNVDFVDGCKISYSTSRQSGSVMTVTMGTTRTVTSVKADVSIDLTGKGPDDIAVTDNLHPHLKTLVFSRGKANGDLATRLGGIDSLPPDVAKLTVQAMDLAVKQEDAEIIRSALVRLAQLCRKATTP